jgi:predicted amidohydrolase YtcJ
VLRKLSILLCGASFLPLYAQVDFVALHGKVWTENPQQPEAEAFAVSGGRILAVGTDAEI